MRVIAHSQRLIRAVGLAALAILICGATQPARSTPLPAQEQAPVPLKITLDPLPDGTVGENYGVTITATGGKRTYGFSATGLPDGLFISRNSDRIMGQPKAAGTYSVVVTVKDSTRPTANEVSATLKLTVAPAH